ncbi:MAG: low temperature requirement protein A [Pelatocladus maniniholoensis HA4357-MV3]|uniref:Low temperature requirement protein A n=1 Tax=Pelatocladus maniniholoensis HA4357-MV3 TaxID=1117104 RepID=A0A9E3H5C3_9NOST|nr:low temperature requirement protein A [Pelatocladus maniniholoensis HA4357-MV3]BAZ70797.1 low temperature requirement A [Fischerella sp. NIES-4106]
MKTWFQPPRLRIGVESEEKNGHATWLELFYDLVFVVAVSQVAHNLSEDVSLSGFFSFVFLFIPMWWAWIGTTFYTNRFEIDDIGHRLLTGGQMVAIATLAVNTHHGLGESSAGFALSYAAGRAMLVIEYLRAARHIPLARPLATRYAQGFAIAAVLWLLSVFVPMPLRFGFWALGLILDFATPLTAKQLQLGLTHHIEHLPERFGLFTIIVLGEAIIGVVDGLSNQNWDAKSALAAIFGFSIAFSLWWVYFENIGNSALRSANATGQIGVYQIWLYGHLPLVIGLTATGVGVKHIISSEPSVALPPPERVLLCSMVALCLLALALLHRTGVIRYCKIRSRFRLYSAFILLILAIVGKGLLPVVVIGLVAIVCTVQVIQDLYQSRLLVF